MANSSYLRALVGSLPADVKVALGRCWDYLCDGNLRFGPVDTNRPRTENFAGIYISGTTPATANTEFSIAHGLGTKPNVLIPFLDLNTINSRIAGDLTVSRAADASRVYLTSASTTATFTAYLES